MDIIPAIDIRGGKCVRLYQGDYGRETVFSEDPVAMARNWKSQGATRLHIVDLDGAASGRPRNMAVVKAIVERTGLPVELGGGIRKEATVSRVLASGVKRVILGTVAVEKPELVKVLCREFGEAIIVGIDARNGRVATRGWLKGTTVGAVQLARGMVDLGVKRIIYPDIGLDGTLGAPDYAGVQEMVSNVKAKIIAAGGISELEHLRRLAAIGVEAAIVGMALYTGRINLKEALALGL